MKFDELQIYSAIHEVRNTIKKLASDDHGMKSVSSSYWERGEGAIELTRMIAEALVTESNELYISAFVRYRKSASVNDGGLKKLDIIAALSRAGNAKCFYSGRGLGECSDEVDLDRILPSSNGGKYTLGNCVLSCSFHNRSRGDKPFEQFVNEGTQ